MRRSEKIRLRKERQRARLEEAVHQRGWSRWKFQQEMEKREVPGASRANIDRYFKGEVDKLPVDFLIQAARLLRVELLWLLGVSDARTVEEAHDELTQKIKSVEGYRERLEREIRKGLPAYGALPEPARGAIELAFMSRHAYLMTTDDPPESGEAGAREVAKAIMAPLKVLQVDPAELSSWQLAHYTLAISQAIALLNLDYAIGLARRGL